LRNRISGLTELGRTPASDGWETVEFQGDDGYRYRVSLKGTIEQNWVAIPREELDED
jgi:hypothetical protein